MWGPTEQRAMRRIIDFLYQARKERRCYHFVFLVARDNFPCSCVASKDFFCNATVGRDSEHAGRSVRTAVTWLKEPLYIVSSGMDWPLRHRKCIALVHCESMPYDSEFWKGEREIEWKPDFGSFTLGPVLCPDVPKRYSDKVYRQVSAPTESRIPGLCSCAAPVRALSHAQGEGNERNMAEIYLDMRRLVDGSSQQALGYLSSMQLMGTFIGDRALYSAAEAMKVDLDGAWRMAGWWQDLCIRSDLSHRGQPWCSHLLSLRDGHR